MKKVLIITTSLRRGSNSEFLAEEFARGAKEAGHDTETVSLAGKRIGYCIGCLTCQKTQRCNLRDDAVEIAEKVKAADVLVFATPVYYYGMCGQMKTLLDRMNPLYPSDYRFREVYVIATAADGEERAVDGTLTGMQGWLDCFPKARLAGVLRGVGLGDPNAAEGRPDMCQRARDMGAQV